MISIEQALQQISEQPVSPLESETVDLKNALGRVLSQTVSAQVAVPGFDNSAMDGFAINTADLSDLPTQLPISQRITAGIAPQPLAPKTAARIFTGAMIPKECDAVVMQENCDYDRQHVTIKSAATVRQNIRARGQDIQQGSDILHAGRKLEAADLGLLAAVGQHSALVRRRLRVATISTGNELVTADSGHLPEGKIYNSNTPMLHALLSKAGCELVHHAHIGDDLEQTKQGLAKAAQLADVVISTGGVSVGEEDHVKAALQALGDIQMWKICVKPGKPLALGLIGKTQFIGLPGNPVSSFVTFLMFAMPLIQRLQGRTSKAPAHFYMPSGYAIAHSGNRPELQRVQIENDKIIPFANQSSGVLTSASWADALALIPAHTIIKEGELVKIYPLASFFA